MNQIKEVAFESYVEAMLLGSAGWRVGERDVRTLLRVSRPLWLPPLSADNPGLLRVLRSADWIAPEGGSR